MVAGGNHTNHMAKGNSHYFWSDKTLSSVRMGGGYTWDVSLYQLSWLSVLVICVLLVRNKTRGLGDCLVGHV